MYSKNIRDTYFFMYSRYSLLLFRFYNELLTKKPVTIKKKGTAYLDNATITLPNELEYEPAGHECMRTTLIAVKTLNTSTKSYFLDTITLQLILPNELQTHQRN